MKATKIINGTPVKRGEIPFYCALNSSENADKYWHCGGAILINDRWALTTAQTAQACGNVNLYVGLDSYKPDASYQEKVGIEDIIIHPKYLYPPTDHTGLYRIPYDIALIKLSRATTSKDFAMVDGLDVQVTFSAGTEMIVAGCGKTEDNYASKFLLKTTLVIADEESCIKVPPGYPPTMFDDRIHICAQGNDNQVAVANGDSGGPLIFREKIVVGLASRVFLHNTYEFTRISYYRDWIREVIYEEAVIPLA